MATAHRNSTIAMALSMVAAAALTWSPFVLGVPLEKTCHCQVYYSAGQLAVYDLTATVGWRPKTVAVLPADQINCRNKCDDAFSTSKEVVAHQLCPVNPTVVPDSAKLVLVSQLGEATNTYFGKEYQFARSPILACKPGWISSTDPTGSVTLDGRCKKEFPLPAGVLSVPPPGNGTPIGDWGFWWANHLVVWGTAANNGAAEPDASGKKNCVIQ